MSARVVRIGLVLAAVVAALALAPAASAAIARGEGTRAGGAECGGPCPTAIWFKGPGSGKIVSNPPGYDCANTCAIEPDNAQVGKYLTLTAVPSDGSRLERWERCPNQQGADCILDLDLNGGQYTMCVVFNNASVPTEATCPPIVPVSPQPPPRPPPPGPPPLGSRCTIPGTSGPNVINGTAGRDVICGRDGNDVINGRGGHDLILGGTGADRLTGGLGRDAIYGGSGNDTLFARDGIRDTVNGGLGRDRARWDARDVRRSIERRL